MSFQREGYYSGHLKQKARVRGGGSYNGWSSSSEEDEDAVSAALGIQDTPLIKAVQQQSIVKVRQILALTIQKRQNDGTARKRRRLANGATVRSNGRRGGGGGGAAAAAGAGGKRQMERELAQVLGLHSRAGSIGNGPMVERKCGLGLTPLMYACQAMTATARPTADSVAIVQLLHEAGADLDTKDSSGETLLMRLCAQGGNGFWALEL